MVQQTREAWLALSRDDLDDWDLVEDLVKRLEVAESSSYAFHPADFERDSTTVVLLNFPFCGVAGILAVQEPDVDRAGFYVWFPVRNGCFSPGADFCLRAASSQTSSSSTRTRH